MMMWPAVEVRDVDGWMAARYLAGGVSGWIISWWGLKFTIPNRRQHSPASIDNNTLIKQTYKTFGHDRKGYTICDLHILPRKCM